MIQSLLIGIALLGTIFNFANTPKQSYLDYDWKNPPLSFGATSYPGSLDALTNPAGTDSVSTVSHSGQHTNANDSIEAIEAKVGTKASTPVNNTIFGGTGAGTSIWTTWATSTSLFSNSATTTNFQATGSTTLNSFTFTTATGTSATTTNLFSTTASSTNLRGANVQGFGLSSCSGTNFVQWTSGEFGCGTPAGVTTFSTTTAQDLATTTFSVANGALGSGSSVYEITFVSASTTGANANDADTFMIFNDDRTTTYTNIRLDNAGSSSNANRAGVPLYEDDANRPLHYYKIIITNNTGVAKFGSFEGTRMATTTAAHSAGVLRQGIFTWENASAITKIDIGFAPSATAAFGAGTKIQVLSR